MNFYRILGLNVFLAATLLPASAFSQTWTDFQVGALTRKAFVYVPTGIDHPPLLISLHGMGIGAGWHQGGMMKFEPIADREKFIVVYPEADQDLRWDLMGTHDIDFVLAIIDEMSRLYDIDRNRVYASGFSMGGMFSYTLACKIPDVIAAIAPGNGYPLGGEFGCVNTRSVPIFHMHGTADDFVPYSGIHAFLNTKVAAYGCPTTPVRTEPYPPSNPVSKSFKEYWGPCTSANGQTSEIILISVAGMIHDWATAGKANENEDPEFTGKPFDIDGSEEAWAFLKTHSLNESASGTGVTAGSGGTGDVFDGGVTDGGNANGGIIDAGSTGGAIPTGGSGGTVLTGGSGGVGGTGYGDAGGGGMGGGAATGESAPFAGTAGAAGMIPVAATGGSTGSAGGEGCGCRIAPVEDGGCAKLLFLLGLSVLAVRHRRPRRYPR